MRRLVAIAVAALVLAGLGSAATGPSLRLASMHPLVVKGRHFHAPERVQITVTANGDRLTKRVRTTTGAFTAGFGDVPVDRCNSFTVRALGARGDEATLKHLPQPECMPATAP